MDEKDEIILRKLQNTLTELRIDVQQVMAKKLGVGALYFHGLITSTGHLVMEGLELQVIVMKQSDIDDDNDGGDADDVGGLTQ